MPHSTPLPIINHPPQPKFTTCKLQQSSSTTPLFSSEDFPNPLEENKHLNLWGKEIYTNHRRDKFTQPPLKPHQAEMNFRNKIIERNMAKGKLREAAKRLDSSNVFMNYSPYFTGRPDESVRNRALRKWTEMQYLYYHICQPAYRSGSMENAMWQVSNKEIKKFVFVQAIVSEFKFDRRLRMEEHCERLYDAFDGAQTSSVDMRLILCSYMNLVLFKTMKENPKHHFFTFYEIFCEPFSDEVKRSDLLNLMSMCATTDDEFKNTRVRLNKGLTNLSTVHGLKDNFKWVDKKLILEVFEVDPGLLIGFVDQCWARCSEEQRLQVLGKKEEDTAISFQYRDHKFKVRQACQLWGKVSE